MGLDFKILEEEYTKIAKDKAEVETRTDLTDEEREAVLASFDKALEGIESGIIALGTKAKEEIQAAISSLEAKITTNENYIKAAEEELARRKAEIEEEMAKENPDQGLIEAKQSEVAALEKRIKSLKTATRKVQKEIKEQKKLLIPLMQRFKDKGIFTEQEIADLEKLDKKIKSGQALAEKRKKEKEPENPGEENLGEENLGEENPREENPREGNPREGNPREENPREENPREGNPGEGNPGEGNPGEGNPGEGNPGEGNQEPRRAKSTQGKVVYVTGEPTEPQVDLNEEFKQLYAKAKKRTLNQKDYTRLTEIMSDPENYDKLGITTGIIFNKSRVILKALGAKATEGAYRTLNDAFDAFGLTKEEPNETIHSTGDAMYWAGIKQMAAKPETKLVSEELFERVIVKADEIGIDNLSEEQKNVLLNARQHKLNMAGFRSAMSAYSEVSTRRNQERWGWLLGKKTATTLPQGRSDIDSPENTEPTEDLSSRLQRDVVPPEAQVNDIKGRNEQNNDEPII